MAQQQAQAEVIGLKALMKDLNKLTKDERSPLFAAMKQAGYRAIQPVVGETRGEIPVSNRKNTRTHTQGALAASVRASAYRSGAAARMGGNAAPFAGWMEFGGKRPDGSTRAFRSAGRYLFPAGAHVAPHAVAEYTREINALFGRTAIWSNTATNGESVHD